MRLHLNKITTYIDYVFDIPDDAKAVLMITRSAGGKTTIAKLFYAYLVGDVEPTLLKAGESRGVARLEFAGRTYTLEITESSRRVDRVLNADYAEYLVFTENTPLYAIYLSPEKIDLNALEKRFLREPEELKKIEAELAKLEKEGVDYDKMIEDYERSIRTYQEMLAEVEAELVKIEAQLNKLKQYENVKVILEKKEKESKYSNLKKVVEEYENELKQIAITLSSIDYNSLKEQRKSVGDELSRLHLRKRLYDEVKDALQTIKTALEKLEDKVDILYELNVPLFGVFPDADTIRSYISDVEHVLEELVSKHGELSTRIAKLQQELDQLDKQISEYIRKYQRAQTLESEIQRLKSQLHRLESEISMLQRKVDAICRELGRSEEEIIAEYTSMEDVNKLMSKKNQLLAEKEKLLSYIRSFEEVRQRVISEKERLSEKENIYEEQKKKYSLLKGEWQKKKKVFREAFFESFRNAFKVIKLEGFDVEELKFKERVGYTYSQSERLYVTIAFQLALATALKSVGFDVPFVVIDLITPLDTKFEKELLRILTEAPVKTILLKTGDKNEIVLLT